MKAYTVSIFENPVYQASLLLHQVGTPIVIREKSHETVYRDSNQMRIREPAAVFPSVSDNDETL